MNKTPYEVRLDVMKMAQEMLDKETQVEETKFFLKLETLRASSADVNTINNFIDSHAPKVYNENDVVARSSALYSFVSESKPTKTKP